MRGKLEDEEKGQGKWKKTLRCNDREGKVGSMRNKNREGEVKELVDMTSYSSVSVSDL